MKTIGEINVLQERYGWQVPTKLTLGEVRRAPSDVIRFWELKCPKVLAEATNSKVAHAKAKAANARNLLTNTVATDSDMEKAEAALNEFLERFPQYVQSIENRDVLARYMLERGLDCRDYADIRQAYEKCALAGSITVIVGEKQLTGDWLKQAIRQTPELLDPLSRKQTAEAQVRRDVQETIRNTSGDILKMAINEMFLEENAVQRSAFEQNAVDQAAQSLLALRPAYIANDSNNDKIIAYLNENELSPTVNGFTAAYDALSSFGELELREGNVHKWNGSQIVNYGTPPTRGGTAVNVVERVDKASLRRKVAGLTAQATAQFWRDNPGAREIFDAA